MRGSTASTIEPAGLRSYFGGASDPNAARTVFLETSNTRAISEIDIRSARHSRRISAQSSTLNTHFLPGSVRARVIRKVVSFRLPRPGQFSRAVDTGDMLSGWGIRCLSDAEPTFNPMS
jgi:hypothetical protein